jgi:ribonucleoside-diphosphate reductase alpha chain
MSARHRLPDRRASTTFDIEAQGLKFSCTVSRYADGSLAEIFLQNHKAGSQAGINAADSAVVCSIAVQHGVPLDTIRRALMRDARGRASGPLGVALDRIGAGK